MMVYQPHMGWIVHKILVQISYEGPGGGKQKRRDTAKRQQNYIFFSKKKIPKFVSIHTALSFWQEIQIQFFVQH